MVLSKAIAAFQQVQVRFSRSKAPPNHFTITESAEQSEKRRKNTREMKKAEELCAIFHPSCFEVLLKP